MNRKTCEKEGAKIIAEEIAEIILEKGLAVLAIPGGRSVSGIFNDLLKEKVDWKKVKIYMVDERLVTIDDDESNYKLAYSTFIKKLVDKKMILEENIHPFRVEKGIKGYESELKKDGGAYDILLLSSGEDGHIGALYPDHHSIKDESDFYIEMDDSPKLPPKRMSMSKNLLLRSKVAILLFFGIAKKEALKKFQDENIEFTSCPCKLVKQLPKHYLLSDIQ